AAATARAPKYSPLASPPTPVTSGERPSTAMPAHSTAIASTSTVTDHVPARSRSPNAVAPMTMLTSGLTTTLAVRDAVIGPACKAPWRKNSPTAPERPIRYGSALPTKPARPPYRSSVVAGLVKAALSATNLAAAEPSAVARHQRGPTRPAITSASALATVTAATAIQAARSG